VLACLQVLEAGDNVLYIDFEDDELTFVGRMLATKAKPNWRSRDSVSDARRLAHA
jgi:hypothetical protein